MRIRVSAASIVDTNRRPVLAMETYLLVPFLAGMRAQRMRAAMEKP